MVLSGEGNEERVHVGRAVERVGQGMGGVWVVKGWEGGSSPRGNLRIDMQPEGCLVLITSHILLNQHTMRTFRFKQRI